LDIVFIGINPSMFAAYTGKYYDGPGNHFWQALYLSGLIPEPMTAGDDHKLLKLGIGFTNIVARTTKGVADLTKKEINEGSAILREKLCRFNPKVAVFNGKAIYEVYSGQKKFMFGRQPQQLPGSSTWLWVMPSSSARCAQLPRVADKVPFFMALRKFRDHLHGLVPELDDSEVVFSNVMLKAQASKKISNKTDSNGGEEIDPNLQPHYNGTPANVPQSVMDVIEDVIQKYNSDFVLADSPASGSSASEITNQSPASSYQEYSNTQSNQVSQQQQHPYHSPSANSPSQNLQQGFQNQNMTGTHPSLINTTPLPAMHTLTRSNRVGVGYYE
jgi:G:T/U-mismatch repair DNA glycosylase